MFCFGVCNVGFGFALSFPLLSFLWLSFFFHCGWKLTVWPFYNFLIEGLIISYVKSDKMLEVQQYCFKSSESFLKTKFS